MFYSDVILTKRGPLANVWLAAMMERRLTKAQLLKTSVEKSVAAIVGHDGSAVPMALRLSGQLLIGVVRIYSRKAKYLLDDCNDALVRIKMAFRTGGGSDATTLSGSLAAAPRNAITLAMTRTELDMMLPDPLMLNWEYRGDAGHGATGGANASSTPTSASSARRRAERHGNGLAAHTARASDITLSRVLLQHDDEDDVYGRAGEFSLTDGGLASFDFGADDPHATLDLGLEERRDDAGRLVDANGDPIAAADAADDSMFSIGVGRRAESEAAAGRSGLGDLLAGDVTNVSGGLGAGLHDDDGALIDLNLMDLGAGDLEGLPPPARPDDSTVDLTPRTADRISKAAEQRDAERAKSGGAGQKRALIDAVTELDDRQRRGANASSSSATSLVPISADPGRYLPGSRGYLQLLTVRDDPVHYFFGAPVGVAPQLGELFNVDVESLRQLHGAKGGDDDDDAARAAKRARTSGGRDDDDEWGSEVGRRADRQGSASLLRLGDASLSLGGDDGMGIDLIGDDGGPPPPPLDVPGLDGLDAAGGDAGSLLRRSARHRKTGEGDEGGEGRLAPVLDRLSTPELASWGEEVGAAGATTADEEALLLDAANPLAIFDRRLVDAAAPRTSSSSTSAGAAAADVVGPSGEREERLTTAQATAQGWSKSTVRAMRIVKAQLSSDGAPMRQPSPTEAAAADDDDDDESRGAARRSEMSFEAVSRNASRRAAAGFFFELLVLGTKDCVSLEQRGAFGDVRVRPRPRLWEVQHGAGAAASV